MCYIQSNYLSKDTFRCTWFAIQLYCIEKCKVYGFPRELVEEGGGDTHRRLVEEGSQFRSYFLCKIITLIKAPGELHCVGFRFKLLKWYQPWSLNSTPDNFIWDSPTRARTYDMTKCGVARISHTRC